MSVRDIQYPAALYNNIRFDFWVGNLIGAADIVLLQRKYAISASKAVLDNLLAYP